MRQFLLISASIATGVVLGGIVLYGIYTASPIEFVTTPARRAAEIDYQAFISIMLTAVSVILAGLGFVIAILAFIGWNSIGERVSTLATAFLKEAIDKGGALHKTVKNEVKDIMYRDISPVDINYEDDEKAENVGK